MENYINLVKRQLDVLREQRDLLTQRYDLRLDTLNLDDTKALTDLQNKYVDDINECEQHIAALENELDRLQKALNCENN